MTLEVMTYVHLFFVNEDRTMYHEESDTPAKARSNIVTDLGQVGPTPTPDESGEGSGGVGC